MDFAGVSNTTMVTAAVVYLFAAIAHAAEWAAARGTGAEAAPAGSRQEALVGAGAPGPEPVADARDREREERALLRVERYGRSGVALTLLAFPVHAIAVVTRGLAADRFPWGNMYEFVSTSLLFVVAVHLFLVLRAGQRWLGLLVTMLATIGLGLAVTVFYVDVAPLVPSLHSTWFIFHIVAAALSGAAFNVGALASVLYLVKDRAERRGAVGGYLAKLPSTRQIDLLAYRAHAFAFPLWTFTIAAGAIWAQYAWGRFWGWDPKETMSLVTWVIYAGYLHARATAGWRGTRAAVLALLGVVAFWFNFIGINLLVSGLHSYAGI
ncbi:c-type cytochrome biogenesis protein CcsB [Auraticoccus sp. F435]|uniref:C-type cytochrome biogenesis protein CcsB n=1 Tax=Auraticoccus cholistanensis TaxID=2656650 RepID=A0A6A9V196_9ACTN|nr:c-type cytochrome biogenesis protein CcsB [Auraticoccus cholistanensis]MVA77029.1 c-type cytochrome biogenesis protein CcsB [Auraticoccus cholistanensis]